MTCAFGACDRSLQQGGPGCYLCDTVATLPQPSRDVPKSGDRDKLRLFGESRTRRTENTRA
jgi:hypothetical protein